MQRVPFNYLTRSLFQRKGSTALTVGSFTLVVLVLIGLLSMVRGIDQTLVGSGEPDRFFVISKNVTAENQSQLSEVDARAVGDFAGVKLDAEANALTSFELVTTAYASGPSGQQVQLNIRGVDLAQALQVHEQLRLVTGRYFDPTAEEEVIVGRGAQEALGLRLGETFVTKRRTLRVTGIFRDAGSPFESEVWTSRENMAMVFGRDYISSVWALVRDPALTRTTVAELNAAQALSVYALTEEDYFAQGAGTAQALQALAWFVAVLMAIGAVFSAMNTMYASVSDRSRELGTMRALGYAPKAVRRALLLEALILALTGGLLACLLAQLLDGLTFRTIVPGIGFVSFQFAVTPGLLLTGLIISLVMGLVGGYAPARRATRMSIIEALMS